MKKKVFGRKLSRERDTRRALFRSLIRALVVYEKIRTTKPKAKAIQADIDKIVSLAKQSSVSAKRRVFAALGNDKKTTKKLFYFPFYVLLLCCLCLSQRFFLKGTDRLSFTPFGSGIGLGSLTPSR